MNLERTWFGCGLAAAILVAAASAAGVFTHLVYARETASWTAQGVGQDWANLLLVVPGIFVTTWMTRRGSEAAVAAWRGLIIYVLYSYVLYAFFLHFNRLFLVYIAILGLSFYALVGSFTTGQRATPREHDTAFASGLLITCSVLFAVLWLAEIVPATVSGIPPKNLDEVGLFVNPVHVLDLAFVLPGMMITGILLRKHRPLGFLFAAPLLVFSAVMGTAIEFMFFFMYQRGLPIAVVPVVIMAVVTAATAFAACRSLRTSI